MDILSLNNEDDYASDNEDTEQEMDENNPVVDESLMSTAEVKGKHKRRHSKCWNHFTIEGDRMPDGKFKCVCNYCKRYYIIDLHRSGTNTLLRHSKHCSEAPSSAKAGNGKKIDQLVFRDMIAMAIVEHDLPYSFVEFRRVREALLYVNPTIEFWCRNTAVADVFKIYEIPTFWS